MPAQSGQSAACTAACAAAQRGQGPGCLHIAGLGGKPPNPGRVSCSQAGPSPTPQGWTEQGTAVFFQSGFRRAQPRDGLSTQAELGWAYHLNWAQHPSGLSIQAGLSNWPEVRPEDGIRPLAGISPHPEIIPQTALTPRQSSLPCWAHFQAGAHPQAGLIPRLNSPPGWAQRAAEPGCATSRAPWGRAWVPVGEAAAASLAMAGEEGNTVFYRGNRPFAAPACGPAWACLATPLQMWPLGEMAIDAPSHLPTSHLQEVCLFLLGSTPW